MQEATNTTLVGIAGILVGIGTQHLNPTTPLFGLGLITYGVVLIIGVAVMRKFGIDVRGGNLG
jgi:hypothetical protein